MFRPANWSLLIPVLFTLLCAISERGLAQDAAPWVSPDWLMQPSDAELFKREKNKPTTLESLKSKTPTAEQKKLAQRFVHFHLSELVLGDDQNLPKNVIDKFIQDLTSPFVSTQIRDLMLEEATVRVLELMDHPKPIVRVNAIGLLNHASISKPSGGINPKPPKPYVGAMSTLMIVAQDHDQTWIVRNTAVIGLSRILRDGDAGGNERSAIGGALLKALKDSEGELWWFRQVIVEALGYANRIDLVGGPPEILEAVMAVLVNPKEHFLVRSQAALSISRLPWNATVNDQLIMEKVAELLEQLSLAQAKSPKAPVWRQCFGRVYLAFRPSYAEEAQQLRWGFLYKSAPVPATTTALWKLAFPILAPFVETVDPTAVPAALIPPLAAYRENKVSDRKVHPQGKQSF